MVVVAKIALICHWHGVSLFGFKTVVVPLNLEA
jgi:hypothetical protein